MSIIKTMDGKDISLLEYDQAAFYLCKGDIYQADIEKFRIDQEEFQKELETYLNEHRKECRYLGVDVKKYFEKVVKDEQFVCETILNKNRNILNLEEFKKMCVLTTPEYRSINPPIRGAAYNSKVKKYADIHCKDYKLVQELSTLGNST